MEEYLNTLLAQIRCRKVKDWIGREIRGHLTEQAQANEAAGMPPQEALEAALKDMGDPVETGIGLDRVHRPRLSVSALLVMALISLLSLAAHALLGHLAPGTVPGLRSALWQTGLGFVVMLAFCLLDYSFLARYAWPLSACYFAVLALSALVCSSANGARAFLSVGPLRVSLIYLTLPGVPLYGALLGRLHGGGKQNVLKAVLLLFPLPLLCLRLPCVSQALLLLLLNALLFSLAVFRNWFSVNKKRLLLTFWSALVLTPLLLLGAGVCFHWFATYQTARLQAFFHPGGSYGDYNYVQNLTRQLLRQSRLFGDSGQSFAGLLPGCDADYILAALAASCGIAAALLICALILFLGSRLIGFSLRPQTRRSGTLIGCGCGLVLVSCTVCNLLELLGLMPLTQTFLPFFSRGGTAMVVCYALTGIGLSVHRWQPLLPPDRENAAGTDPAAS